MSKHIEDKKTLKKKKLYDAAYELFLSKGTQNTVIDDIVKKAGVAKGTFYVYFKNKYDILEKIVLNKSCEILREALEATDELESENFIDVVIFVSNYIIEYFRANKLLLKVINKNISWGIFRKAIVSSDQYEEMKYVLDSFKNFSHSYETEKELEYTVYLVIELVGSVAYNAIILNEPDDIDTMKPFIFRSIRKILE